MFSSTPKSLPLATRAWGITLGTIIMVAVPTCLVSAKTVQIWLPLLLIAALAGAVLRGQASRLHLPFSAAAICLFGFLLYAGCSSLWSPHPQATALIVLMAIVVAAGSMLLAELLRTERLEDALHMREGLWIGFIVGLVYTVAEAASDQSIKIWVYNTLRLEPSMLEPARFYTWHDGRVVAVHSDDLKRNAFSIPILMWPALMAAATLASAKARSIVRIALVGLSIAAVSLSTSQTSKLALVAGVLAYCRGKSVRPSGTLGTFARLGIGVPWYGARWCCCCVISTCTTQACCSSRHSCALLIWSRIAQLVPDAPILGVGADMTYYIRPLLLEAPRAAQGWLGFPIPHPHNVFLQVWYELGAVGAVIFAAFGLLLLRQIADLNKVDSPTRTPCSRRQRRPSPPATMFGKYGLCAFLALPSPCWRLQ